MIKDVPAIIAIAVTGVAAINTASATTMMEFIFSVTFGIIASIVGLGTLWLKWKNYKISLREINLTEEAAKKNKSP